MPVFILDPHFIEPWRIGVNQFSFFLQGLEDLDAQLRAVGSRLVVLRGKPEEVPAAQSFGHASDESSPCDFQE